MQATSVTKNAHYYIELCRAAEHLNRRFLDVLRTELSRRGIRELNTIQALLLANIGDGEISMRQLIERGHYQPSVVSYHIRKLSELGYLELERSPYDKRAVNIQPTDKARAVIAGIAEIERNLESADLPATVTPDALTSAFQTLRHVERIWTEYIGLSAS